MERDPRDIAAGSCKVAVWKSLCWRKRERYREIERERERETEREGERERER